MNLSSFISSKPKPDGVEFYRAGVLRFWKWRIVENKKTIGASSEGFWNRADCEQNLLEVGNRIREHYFNERY